MFRKLLATTIFAALSATAVYAETRLEAKIPFNFHVGVKQLSAGDYTIRFDANNVVFLSPKAAGQSGVVMIAMPRAGKVPAEGAGGLLFNRYGDTYILSKLWRQPVNHLVGAPKAPIEKELVARGGYAQTAEIALRSK